MTTTAVEDHRQSDGTPDPADGANDAVCYARQPILDRDGMLCGFAVKVFCDTSAFVDGHPAADEDGVARAEALAAQAIIGGLLQPNMRGALAGHPAYLNVNRAILFDESLTRIPAERFVFELPPDIVVDSALVARIVALHAKRYRFVLDDVTSANEVFAKLLAYVDGVKIDLHRIAPALLPKLSSVLKAAGKLLIAAEVETAADLERAQELGFDRFQGYFFARPQSGGARRVSAPRHALLNLLQLLAGDPTVAQLEAELKLNPVLVMHLMKLANSSGLAVGHKVSTLREAINATGTDRIARWTQLLLYADGRKVALEDDPLLQLAASRARFMELAIERLPDAGRDEADAAFLTGVFSFVDAVFGGALETTLNVLTLSRPIQAAILHREGRLGALLSAIAALERGAWQEIDALGERLTPLTTRDVAALGLVAAAWAGVADRSAEAQGLERIED